VPDRTFRSLVAAAFFVISGAAPRAQALLQPTASPTVTADDEQWYQSREPIVFAGNVYYPGGPQTYFNRNEMVRTGSYGGVPLYSRTTLEPFSVVFVPVSGGLMQPYERRRTGELSGTVGSTTPSFPGLSASSAPAPDSLGDVPQAPGPPTGYTSFGDVPVASDGAATVSAVATTGATSPAGAVRPRLTTAARPEGLNGIYVVFGDQRWFSNGPAVTLAQGQFVQIGESGGLPVYRDRARSNTIYVTVAAPAESLVAPYSLRAVR
jgi:hypothetical protein